MPRLHHVYLASQSPRRRELLHQIGVKFEWLPLRSAPGRPPDVVEIPHPGEAAPDYVLRIAQEKAQVGWERVLQRRLPQAPVLAADTEVVLDGRILGKPRDTADAERMLASLSWRTHQVITTVALCDERGLETRTATTEVTFRPLSPEEIRHYVQGGETMDKAGAYGIQGMAAIFVQSIHGSYSGVMGLPLFETADLLRQAGLPVL